MNNKLSPRGNWIIENTKEGKILHVGFAGSEDEPDVIFTETGRHFPKSVLYGVDVAADKVKKLNRPNTIVADGRNLPYKANFFDCVVIAEVIEHLTDPMPFFVDAYRVLKPGGIILVTTPNPLGIFRLVKHYLLAYNPADRVNVNDYLGFNDHKMFFDPLSLCKLLYLSGFKKINLQTVNMSIPYITRIIGEINIPIWPFTRLGTYICIKAEK